MYRFIALQVVVALAFASLNAFSADAPVPLKVSDRGKQLKTVSLDDLKTLVTPKKIRVFEPHEMREQGYTGVDTRALLAKLYPAGWDKVDEVLFTCADGYQAAVSVKRLKDYDSYLVFEREGDPSFSVTNKHQNNEHVALGPFYLVWDNLKSPELKKTGAFNWPYQVVGVDLVALKDRFPHSFPKAHNKSTASAGFAVFRDKCMTCHKVNGDGGDKAPELNTPVSVTEYWKREWLEKFIWDPRSVRTGSTMPGLKDVGTKAELKSVLDYLDAMKSEKRKY